MKRKDKPRRSSAPENNSIDKYYNNHNTDERRERAHTDSCSIECDSFTDICMGRLARSTSGGRHLTEGAEGTSTFT